MIKQHVVGFDIPVQNQVVVRVLNRRADLTKRIQRILQAALLAVSKGLTLDVLHHQITTPIDGPTIQELGDVWVPHARQYFPLIGKPTFRITACPNGPNKLYRHSAFERAICPLALVHRTHTTLANKL